MFNQTHKNKRNHSGAPAVIAGKDFKRSRRLGTAFATILMAVLPLTAFGEASSEAIGTNAARFVNVVDNTQGFSSFGSAPAINNALAVAFESAGTGFESGSVWKWNNGRLTRIATSADGSLRRFGDVVVINSAGRVGFSAGVVNGNDSIIATGDGGALNVIASANATGLVGGQFLGISAINERGDVVFLGVRKGFGSQAIFAGKGGPLTPVVDTATDANFAALGNADIDASGKVAFRGFLADGTEGIFLRDNALHDVVDTNNPSLADFLDPVINNKGTVGSAAFLQAGGLAVFTANARGITPRTNSSSFSLVDNVSINNLDDVAFFATETVGRDGIFVEPTGSSNPVPVIETGDPLFGSTVVALSIGRFSLNDGGWITFRYELADGRTGIAVASPQN
jgi:hypothetical protein